ncbi:MAG: SoxR reducing system RseC family protein [Nitrospirae bacterium]|nr:SoxR reducing system RseC family protein [Nitrospirota bacterium]
MEEIGIVKSVYDTLATVAIEKTSVCSACKSSDSCDLLDDKSTIEAVNAARATVGQLVVVDMKGFGYVKGTLFVYGLPALALLVGAIIGKHLNLPFLSGINVEVLSAATGFFFLLVTLVAVKLLTGRLDKKAEHTPIIIKIIEGG